MEKIASFKVDHRFITPGIYISRVDGDITTYDLRTRKPNLHPEELMTNAEMHSTEHLFATHIRNSAIKNDVIYFGPMGCQTGYYLLVRNADHGQVIGVIKELLKAIISYEGNMPGNSEIECGNYKNLDLKAAKAGCRMYYDAVENITVTDLEYPTC